MATFSKTASGHWKAVLRKTSWRTVCETFRTKRDAQDWARGLTKNGSARSVPLTIAAMRTFEAALANPLRPTCTDPVFFGEPGKDGARRPYRFQHGRHAARRAAGLLDLRFHDLRHEAISRLEEAGLSDHLVAAISGHNRFRCCSAIYI